MYKGEKMRKKIRVLSCSEVFFLIIIFAYAFDFGIIKYILACLFVIVDIIWSIYKNDGKYRIGKNGHKYISILKGVFLLAFITFILQVKNGFQSYAINEVIYWIIPLFFVICYTKDKDKIGLDRSMKLSFWIFVASFIYKFMDEISIKNILSISFIDSYSPFESELAFIFLVYEFYFISQKSKSYSIYAMIGCILSFKRLCCIVSILIYVVAKFMNIYKPISEKAVIIVTIIIVMLPVVTCFAIDHDVEKYVYLKYKVSLNEITLSRSQRLKWVLSSNQIKYGLGSTTVYLTEKLNAIHDSEKENWNLHNDLVKIYIECGIIGIIGIIYVYLKNFSQNRISFFLIVYILLECYFNHLFGAGTAQIWIIIYIFLASQNTDILQESGGKKYG